MKNLYIIYYLVDLILPGIKNIYSYSRTDEVDLAPSFE